MISACLIIKNEEYWIKQCLDKIRTYPVGEVIIVDGGSTDNTLEIIKSEYTEVKLFERPMPESFADQRNFAKAQATGDWILSVDADETWDNPEKFVDLVQLSKYVGFSFPTKHVATEQADADPHIRLFANRPDIVWERELHEYLTLNGEILYSHPSHMGKQSEFLLWVPDVTLVHWAYTAPKEKLRAKVKFYQGYNYLGTGIQVNSEEDLLPK